MAREDIDKIPDKNYSSQDELPRYMAEMPDRICKFYTGKVILITGGTGFLGKILLEKLLRKVPDVGKIFLLIRTKKGKDPKYRLDELFNNAIFAKVKANLGLTKLHERVQAISGDVGELNLGMSDEDRQLLIDSIEIVIHSAATIRFDDPLKKAVLLNTRGTKLMIQLAKEMKKLKLFTHISTAYCHLDQKILEEKTYPSLLDPHKVIKTCELIDENLVESLSKKILKGFPNTYAFTKNLGEAIVVEAMKDGLPCIILRPPVVIPAWLEPIPGWTDNINGPVGLLIGAGKGVIRTMYCDNTGYADYLPVDICANGIIVTIWNYLYNESYNMTVFNFTSSSEWQITWQEVIDIGKDIVTTNIPLNYCVWYPGGSMKRSKFIHNICVVLFHTIPAYFLDAILYLTGNKPILVRIQDRINKGFEVFEYYANNQWHFENKQAVTLRAAMNERERVEYKVDGINMDVRKYFEDCILAAREYVLKEPPETIPTARRHTRIMYWVDVIAKILFTGLIIWFFTAWSKPLMNFFMFLIKLIEHIFNFFKTDNITLDRVN